jgi:hypothetical protein
MKVKLTWCDGENNAAGLGLDEVVEHDTIEGAKRDAEYHAECQGIDLERYHVEGEAV